MYKKHINSLKQGFEQIKLAVGITKVEDIVTGFIKSEEQNHSLYQYLSNLSKDIDEIECLLTQNLRKIEKLIEDKTSTDKQMEKLSSVHGKYKDIDKKLKENRKITKKVSFELEGSMANIKKILIKLSENQISDSKTPKTESISNENIIEYLSTIDEKIEKLSAFMTFSNKSPKNDTHSSEKIKGNLNFVLDQKDLYNDEDIEDQKIPLEKQDFSTKAQRIISSKLSNFSSFSKPSLN